MLRIWSFCARIARQTTPRRRISIPRGSSAVSAISAVNPWLVRNSLDTQRPLMYNIHLTNRGFLIWRTNLQLKHPSLRGIVSNLVHFDFDIVSDFDIRFSLMILVKDNEKIGQS